MEIEEVKKEVTRIVREELKRAAPGHKAFFFGSRVSGTASPRADLDVGIEGKTPLPPKILQAIKIRCEGLRTLYSIDIVDFSATSDDFKKVAKEYVERIV